MRYEKEIALGLLTLFIVSGSIFYVQFADEARMRLDVDGSTFYVPHSDYHWLWVVSGREESRLFDGSRIINRDKRNVAIQWYGLEDGGEIRAVMKTPYQRGPVVYDEWVFNPYNTDIELFPISHKKTVVNGTGYFLRYTVDDLVETGPKRKLTGETELNFGRNMKVELNPGYRWAWVGWPYGGDSLSAQYKLSSDLEVFQFRLFDPPPTMTGVDLNSTLGTNATSENLTAFPLGVADADGDPINNITDFRVGGFSIAVLNMPFENNTINSSNSTKDYSSFSTNGSVVNATFLPVGGFDGFGAYNFSVAGDHIAVGSATGSLNISQHGTLAAWFFIDSAISDRRIVTHGDQNIFMIFFNGANLGTRLFDGANRDLNSGFTSSDLLNTWTHIAATFNGTNMSIYVNGVLNGTIAAGTLKYVAGNTDTFIGSTGGGTSQFFDGRIDDVRMYNRSLSSAQVLALFQNKTSFVSEQETVTGEVWDACVTPTAIDGDGTQICSNNLTIVGCDCPGLDTNWVVSMTDLCFINTPCDIGVGNLSFVGTGNFTINTTVNVSNIENVPSASTIWMNAIARFFIG